MLKSMKCIHFYPTISVAAFLLLFSCKSFDHNRQNKQLVTYKFIKYSLGNTKEEYKYVDGVLASIKYLEENEAIDSIELYHNGKLSSTIRYSYLEDGTINADNYKGNSLMAHLVYDSFMNLLYETPLLIPKITHTTYRFRSGRTYFDQNKIDTIEIINEDFPPYNKGYIIRGASLIPINHLGVFAITNYQKSKAPDHLKLWLTVSQNIALDKPSRQIIDSFIIPIK